MTRHRRPTTHRFESGFDWPAGSLLGTLPASIKQGLLRLGVRQQFEAGKVLIRQGEQSTHAFLMLDGFVQVTASTEAGDVALLDIRAGGDLVGELAALDGQPRSATVAAAGSVIVRLIDQAELRAYLRDNPDAWLAVTRGIAAKLRWATRRRIDFSGGSAMVRLMRVLIELAESYGEPNTRGGGVVITTSLTQPELAALVGAAERTVHKALAELRERRLVNTGYRRITVLDPQGLEAAIALGGARA
jgi:CRP/FNR family transcriptional regulator, cyclic AMP receptor protein